MVNRISQLLEATGRPSHGPSNGRGGQAAQLHEPTGRRWLDLLEREVGRRPKLFLSLAFTLGVGLAWLMKRK